VSGDGLKKHVKGPLFVANIISNRQPYRQLIRQPYLRI